jgi:short-subunit dehydrogenase
LRAETAKDGIRVTMVVPGYVRTRVSNNALKADGTPHGVMDDTHQKAMLPAVAAKTIVDAVESRKAEVRLGGKEIYAVLLRRFFPGVLRKIVRVK